MSKFKIINLLDKVFISVCVFLLIFAWINFFLRDLWITFFLSIIFSSSCLFLIFFFSSKHQLKKSSSKKYLQDLEEKFLAFQIMSKHDKLKLISNIVSKRCENRIKKDSIVFISDEKNQQIMIDVNNSNFDNLSLYKCIERVEKNTNVLWIICDKVEANLNTNILNNLEIKIIGKKEFYDQFFLVNSIFPDTTKLNTKKEKLTLKIIGKNMFLPSKAKSYFLCGLVLIFSSIILPFRTYYLIFGSVFLLFSIVCKFKKFFKF